MTYQVLARKWRPRSFDTLIGQDHVVRALTHALDSQRLHHAWLFTGTRGVGKTTLSRILAKALNCEKGVSATPCGECRSCIEIDQGRFIDYVELDAASNRGVDEMTQLLEQAVYAPSAARYKVYMIDEVHMLTGHAFNAMLKTLEEPPAHVKFILATTDPQKIPVTVLSRCLQFNLKQMTVPAIEAHLQYVLNQENISTETPALRLLAQAATGSMRDALSLTDQAISYSAGSITTESVQGMLGTIDQSYLIQIIQALVQGQGAQLIAIADDMALRGLSFSGALADLAVLLSRIAIEQRVPGALPPDEPNVQGITQLAQQLSPDHVQLFYSIAVHSRDELSLAPDEYAGFIMACLRMYALTPAGSLPVKSEAAEITSTPKPTTVSGAQTITEPESEPEAIGQFEAVAPLAVASPPDPAPEKTPSRAGIQPPVIQRGVQTQDPINTISGPEPEPESKSEPEPEMPSVKPVSVLPVDDVPPWVIDNPPIDDSQYEQLNTLQKDPTEDFPEGGIEEAHNSPPLDDAVLQAVAALELPTPVTPKPETLTPSQWAELTPTLALSGWAAELAQQAEWVSCDGSTVVLRVEIRSADDSQAKSHMNTVLNEYFGQVLRLQIEYGNTGNETAFAIAQAERAQRQEKAETAAQQNPFILALMQQFDAQIVPDSIQAK